MKEKRTNWKFHSFVRWRKTESQSQSGHIGLTHGNYIKYRFVCKTLSIGKSLMRQKRGKEKWFWIRIWTQRSQCPPKDETEWNCGNGNVCIARSLNGGNHMKLFYLLILIRIKMESIFSIFTDRVGRSMTFADDSDDDEDRTNDRVFRIFTR